MFNLKIYDILWNFKDTIEVEELKNPLSFTAAENQWQWQCRLLLDFNFEDDLIVNTDVIRIYQDTTLIYTGIVQDVIRKITNTYEEVEIPLLWLWTLWMYLLYKDTWSYVFSKNQDPSQTIRDIIDYINANYTWGWLSYDWSSIDNYWTSTDIDFEYNTCFDAIQKCIEVTNFKLYIDQSWKVFFKLKPTTPTHEFTVWKDVEEIKLEEDSEKLVNKLLLKYKTWVQPYEDSWSQISYWLKEKYIQKTDLVDINAANEYWNNYISTYKDPINKTSITINSNYDIKTIKVWDTIEVKNFKFEIKNLQIVKFTYTIDKIKLDLELFDSFWKEFSS